MQTSTTSDVLTQLRSEWIRLGRSAASRRAMSLLREAAPDEMPPGARDLGDLVLALEPRGGLSQLQRARILEVLLAHAGDPTVRRCLLQTLLPGIVSVARKLRFGEGIADDPGTFLSDGLAEASELLCDWAGQRRPYAGPDLLGALRCRMRRRMLSDKRRRTELTGLPDRVGPQHVDHLAQLAADLREAADSGVPDTELVYARCILGFNAAELAGALGISGSAVKRRLAMVATPLLA
jgi:hypothetical protein